MNEDDRKAVLESLVAATEPVNELRRRLVGFKWDSEVELVVLRSDHLRQQLQAHDVGEVSDQELVDWANLIECRDDIGLEPEHSSVLKQAVFELANPILAGVSVSQLARRWLKALGSQGDDPQL